MVFNDYFQQIPGAQQPRLPQQQGGQQNPASLDWQQVDSPFRQLPSQYGGQGYRIDDRFQGQQQQRPQQGQRPPQGAPNAQGQRGLQQPRQANAPQRPPNGPRPNDGPNGAARPGSRPPAKPTQSKPPFNPMSLIMLLFYFMKAEKKETTTPTETQTDTVPTGTNPEETPGTTPPSGTTPTGTGQDMNIVPDGGVTPPTGTGTTTETGTTPGSGTTPAPPVNPLAGIGATPRETGPQTPPTTTGQFDTLFRTTIDYGTGFRGYRATTTIRNTIVQAILPATKPSGIALSATNSVFDFTSQNQAQGRIELSNFSNNQFSYTGSFHYQERAGVNNNVITLKTGATGGHVYTEGRHNIYNFDGSDMSPGATSTSLVQVNAGASNNTYNITFKQQAGGTMGNSLFSDVYLTNLPPGTTAPANNLVNVMQSSAGDRFQISTPTAINLDETGHVVIRYGNGSAIRFAPGSDGYIQTYSDPAANAGLPDAVFRVSDLRAQLQARQTVSLQPNRLGGSGQLPLNNTSVSMDGTYVWFKTATGQMAVTELNTINNTGIALQGATTNTTARIVRRPQAAANGPADPYAGQVVLQLPQSAQFIKNQNGSVSQNLDGNTLTLDMAALRNLPLAFESQGQVQVVDSQSLLSQIAQFDVPYRLSETGQLVPVNPG